MRASSRRRPGPAARPWPVPGGAVGPGQRVQPGQQRPGVAHVPADRGVGPLARRRSRGTAGAARPGVDTSATTSLREAQRGQPLAGHLAAPTTSWWWNATLPPGSSDRVLGLPMSCSSAASRSTRSGRRPYRCSSSIGLLAARSASAGRRPCAGGARRSPAAARAPRAAPRRPPRCRTISSIPRPGPPGAAASISLVSSSVIRSADTIGQPRRQLPHRRLHLGRDGEARAGRRTGPRAASAAGRRRTSPPGCPGVRSTLSRRSASPPNGSTSS